ncbi:MAG: aminomethyltransferase family protein [Woeseiaceae bacterium]
MLRKSAFYDFLDRRSDSDFASFLASSAEDQDYIDWNGFLMPMHYGDAELEYFAIREGCAMCDVSPMRKIRIRGKNAGAFFDRLLTRPVSGLAAMQATYTILCNDDGNLKDDAILYKLAEDDYLMMPSDVDHSPYFATVCQRFDIGDVEFIECTDAWVGVALQGPQSADVLKDMGFADVELLEPFSVREYDFANATILVARMGFTADLGYECWLKPEQVDQFCTAITNVRSSRNIALPGYGLDALQACRLEGGFIVAGWDCSTEIDPQPGFERTPYELGLGWLVNLDANDFVGREALITQKENGPNWVLRSFSFDENKQPDDGAPLYADGENESIGQINCSNWSWGLQKMIGNASIRARHRVLDNAWVEIGGARVEVTLSRGPHITLERRNRVPANTIS